MREPAPVRGISYTQIEGQFIGRALAAQYSVMMLDMAETDSSVSGFDIGSESSVYSNLIAPTADVRFGILVVIQEAITRVGQQVRGVVNGRTFVRVSGPASTGGALIASNGSLVASAPLTEGDRINFVVLDDPSNLPANTKLVEMNNLAGRGNHPG